MKLGALRDWAVRMIGGGRYVAKDALPWSDGAPGRLFNQPTQLGNRAQQIKSYQGMVAVCVNRIALDIASLEPQLFKKKGRRRDDWLEVSEHPLVDLLERPNPHFSGFDLLFMAQSHLELTGMAFWLVLENRLGRPAELWPLFPQHLIRIETGSDTSDLVRAFVFRSDSGQEVSLAPEQVLYLRNPHPESLAYGASTIQQQAFAYDINLAIKTYQRNLMGNQARPDVVLSSDQHLTKDDADRARAAYNAAFHSGGGVGGLMVTGAGIKVVPFTLTPRDGEFMALAAWTQDEILAAFGVPAGKLGLVKDVNRANMLELDTTYHRECLHPRTLRWAFGLSSLAARYGAGLWCELAHEIPKDREFEHAREKDRLDRGVITINEVRADDGLEPQPGGDVPHLPGNMMPLGEAKLVRGDQGGGEQLSLAAPVAKDQTQDEALWADFASRTLPWQRHMAARLAAVFQRQAVIVAARLHDAWPRLEGRLAGWGRAKVRAALKSGAPEIEFVLDDRDRWDEDLNREAWQGVLPPAILEAAQDALSVFNMSVKFNMRSQAVTDWLRSCAATAAKVDEHTREKIRANLVEAAERGETFDQVVERMNGIFDWAEGARAETIARTEVCSARRFGYHEGLLQSGAPFLKEWRNEPGARPSHASAGARYREAGAIPMNKAFIVGGCSCQIPGHSGCAKEDINCRCYVRYRPAPQGTKAAPEPPDSPRPIARFYSEEECHGAGA